MTPSLGKRAFSDGLLERIAKGDVNAYRLLMDRYKEHALKIIKRRLQRGMVHIHPLFHKTYLRSTTS